jgi:flavin-dependent dehydrogenase
VSATSPSCDVLIVGGGPGGSTAGTLLRKYAPHMRVTILEKAKFPRDHIGESQLPLICTILDEMGCWDKIEAANFPIKIGATYKWGRDPRPWDFNFVPPEQFRNEPRPAKFEGQRRYTAFQVDRSIYDDILLKHARETGCDVREETQVVDVLRDGDRVAGLRLADGSIMTARHYIDASGTVGLFRRAFEIGMESPEKLRNVAFWDYWQNAEWAEEIGVGGTRIQVLSLPYGWIWFIPIGPTRTSIGLVCHAEYYRKSGMSPEELYRKALADETLVARLIANATPRGCVETTRDWSFVCDRLYGENWFLVGEAAGFADPILSAGMTLAHAGARDAAYTIMELERGEHDRDWLLQRFDAKNRESLQYHIRFAIYWYSVNGLQTDLTEYCAELAKSAGLRLNAKDAFRWISQGAFTTELLGSPSIAFFDLTSVHDLTNRFAEGRQRQKWLIDGHSVLQLNLHGATLGSVGDLRDGRIHRIPCYLKGEKKLPMCEFYGLTVDLLKQTQDAETLMELAQSSLDMLFPREHHWFAKSRILEVLESMALDGWLICKRDRKRPPLVIAPETDTISVKE